MPLTVPPVADERDGLLAFLAQQRAALRNAAYGLSDDQARTASTASSLTIGGILKHVAGAERDWIDRVAGAAPTGPGDPEAYMAGFRMDGDESLADMLALYEAATAHTDAVLGGVTDLDAAVALPPAPWFPASATVRWVLLHLIEETARHAGHADIIRESLDSASAGELMAAAEGWEPSQWVTPWKPAASV